MNEINSGVRTESKPLSSMAALAQNDVNFSDLTAADELAEVEERAEDEDEDVDIEEDDEEEEDIEIDAEEQ